VRRILRLLRPYLAENRRTEDVLDLSTRTLSLIAIIALVLSVLAVLFAIGGGGGRRRPKQSIGPIPMDDALRALLKGQAAQIHRLEQAVRVLNGTDKKQQIQIDGSVRKVALLRYDAFEDVGGRLSFSCALLDDHGTGVVLTSINGRQETRVYAKPVDQATSSYNLSVEEAEAIRQAMASAAEPVEAR
jgi:hypothetical protein